LATRTETLSPQPSNHELPDLLPLVAAGWARKGIRQKQHLSEPRPGAESVMEKRAHADRCVTLPEVLEGGEVDLMIEVGPRSAPLSISC